MLFLRTHTIMITSLIKISLSILRRHWGYTLVNTLGLSVGLLVSLLVLLYVWDDLSYDKHHENHERIYRLESVFDFAGQKEIFALTGLPLGPVMKMEFPEIQHFVRFVFPHEMRFNYQETEYVENTVLYADSTVFDIFTHRFIQGNPQHALTEPNTMVLTESLATKWFGDADPMGEMVAMQGGSSLKVTAVIEDLPTNSHLKFCGLISLRTIAEQVGQELFNSHHSMHFWNVSYYTYIQLHPGASADGIMEQFPAFNEKYIQPTGSRLNATFDLMLTPLRNIYHTPGLSHDLPSGNKAYTYLISLIGFLILSLALVNYTNLATARSQKRMHETGVRKLLGAKRTHLFLQYLCESYFLVLIAFVIALAVFPFILPIVNQLADKHLLISSMFHGRFFLTILALFLSTGFLAGFYPAVFLSSFKPAKVLKGNYVTGGGSAFLRKSLVVFQLAISVGIILATLVLAAQLRFLQNKDLGYEPSGLIVVDFNDAGKIQQLPAFVNELSNYPEIKGAAACLELPFNTNMMIVFRVEQEDHTPERIVRCLYVDHQFFELMGFELLKGRLFDKNMQTDLREAVIINETAVQSFGWEDDPIGKRLYWEYDSDLNPQRTARVIGVVKDFHFESLHNQIEPMVLCLSENNFSKAIVRYDPNQPRSALERIESLYEDFFFSSHVVYHYHEDQIQALYSTEKTTLKIFTGLSVIAVIISLLGLAGLASFVCEQRSKEIGIRKVFGASGSQVLQLLYREFGTIAVIALSISIPFTYYLTQNWLQKFAYVEKITANSIVQASLLVLLMGFLIVTYYARKISRTNPTHAIKTP